MGMMKDAGGAYALMMIPTLILIGPALRFLNWVLETVFGALNAIGGIF